MPKSGYLVIYYTNETKLDVYVDDIVINHRSGPLLQESDTYAFGGGIDALESRSFGRAENKYGYNGKEKQPDLGLEWLDYGARMYDAQVGRWKVQDNYSETYLGLTPYNYGGNNPINIIEIDGNLFIFANGFMLNHWSGQDNNQYRLKGQPRGLPAIQEPNPNYKIYAPDRGFYPDGPRNNGKKFENDYWEGVDQAYMLYNSDFKGEEALYTNGSFTPQATASARFNEGLTTGAELIAKLESGEISLKKGETIKIVGHSQGAAYAAGIASALSKDSKYGNLLEFVDYLSPHQPGDIRHPNGIKGRQFSTKSDKVSSTGPIAKHFGGSKYEKIPGTEWGKEREKYDGGRGGHSVGTWLNDLIIYWQSLGITVNVHE